MKSTIQQACEREYVERKSIAHVQGLSSSTRQKKQTVSEFEAEKEAAVEKCCNNYWQFNFATNPETRKYLTSAQEAAIRGTFISLNYRPVVVTRNN